MFDIEDDNTWTATMFFETDENTDFKKLMLLIVGYHPDEFTEETPNHFRLWFD